MAKQLELFDTLPDPWHLDAAADALVAKVVFPSAPAGEFDYLVPDALRAGIGVGSRVRVPLGKSNKTRLAYCVAVEVPARSVAQLKSIQAIIDTQPLIGDDILALSSWISDYYLCDRGTVLETVIPASVRSKSGTREVTYLSFPGAGTIDLDQFKLPPKQLAVLQALVAAAKPMTPSQLRQAAQCTQAPITALRQKGLLVATVRRELRTEIPDHAADVPDHVQLSVPQENALRAVVAALDRGEYEAILVHGVTGSGKTEVYIRAIEHVVSFGRQAIVLVPEISLTPQTRRRFQSRFPQVAVLHSHLTGAQRHTEWQRIKSGDVQVVVGARSAVFAPLPHLGLIVIDEEHETSFKQESAPRYHAREVALERARHARIPLVLGSATPSLESWHQARMGKFKLVQLPGRVMDRPLPAVGTVDLRDEWRRSGGRKGAISERLGREMNLALADHGQVILLLNRRGFATHIQCPSCGHVVRCPHCDIALTLHRENERAICHYCDFQDPAPTRCPQCGFSGIRFGGYGTQRLEAEVRANFPGARVQRMDTDTMRAPGSHEAALDKFKRHEVDILLGTQMIAKGLDFPNVTLVGVINADTALHFADFRAGERTFQLVTQVAGRTGRGVRGGRVLVQTFAPDHPAIQAATRQDFEGFAEYELPQREHFFYPPFAQLTRLVFRGDREAPTEAFAQELKSRLQRELEATSLQHRLLGPAKAPLAKLRGKFRYHVLLLSSSLESSREELTRAILTCKAPQGVEWIVDVDALSML